MRAPTRAFIRVHVRSHVYLLVRPSARARPNTQHILLPVASWIRLAPPPDRSPVRL